MSFRKKTLVASLCLLVTSQIETAAIAQTTPPTISPNSQVSAGSFVLNMSALAGSIYFTTDGSVPSSKSNLYQGSFQVNELGTTQFNAIAINGGVSSTVTSAYYVLDNDFQYIATPYSWYLNCFGPAVTGKIPTWFDLMSLANASQTNSTYQPSLLANSINGLPAISFSGTTYYSLPSTTFTNSGVTIFAVVNPTTLTPSAQILNYSGATVPQNLVGLSESTANAAQFTVWNSAGTSSTSVTSSTALVANQYQLIDVVQGDISGTTATLYVNGIQAGQNTAMNIIPAASLTKNFMGQYSGGAEGFKGDLAEVLIYLTPLTTSQRCAVESYLLSKYQILSQTPTAPVFSNASGTFTQPTQVAISAQPGSSIRFTVDGTSPGATSPLYVSPIQINYTQTLKAVAIQNSILSSTTSATYTLSSTEWPAPATGGPALQINLTAPSLAIP